MKTREQYLDGKCTHREYYAQFVSERTKSSVLSAIGLDSLLASTDKHLNDIPLKTWDRIYPGVSRDLWQSVGDYATLAGLVCINKEAARQIIEAA